MEIVGDPVDIKFAPQNSVDAQFSVYFQAAAAWLDGKLDWHSYQRLGSDEIAEAIGRVTAGVSAHTGHETTVTVRAGERELAETVAFPLGEPGNWVGDEALHVKFASLAEPVFGRARTDDIAAQVSALGPETDMQTLTALLRAS